MTKKKTLPVRKVETAAPKAEEAPKKAVRRFYSKAVSHSHGEQVYPVKDGIVELPAGETWYQELVRSGALTPVKED